MRTAHINAQGKNSLSLSLRYRYGKPKTVAGCQEGKVFCTILYHYDNEGFSSGFGTLVGFYALGDSDSSRDANDMP